MATSCGTQKTQASTGCCGCSSGTVTFDGTDRRYRQVLWVIIVLNAAMFFVEMGGGLASGSLALQADSLDFAGDAMTYGLSLAVIGMAAAVRAKAALLKGLSLGLIAAYILGSALYRTFVVGVPEPLTMGVIGIAALAVNLGSVALLWKWREGDANVRSVWLCSRNDAIGNLAVLFAAGVVAVTGTKWADLAVAALMSCLFLQTSFQVIRTARGELAAA
ncbi:cation transporter [Pedomonas mirosovicensis]|uniref:cation transporter n=1 Tax=Pedomonas mirosovicensis TaxID=2908641 RepID=UPI0021687B39|nr:cation transporter [Pedomonas mirosovicensis]MCH8684603.1 cation transporter [Pedomonas mirosovicensis]